MWTRSTVLALGKKSAKLYTKVRQKLKWGFICLKFLNWVSIFFLVVVWRLIAIVLFQQLPLIFHLLYVRNFALKRHNIWKTLTLFYLLIQTTQSPSSVRFIQITKNKILSHLFLMVYSHAEHSGLIWDLCLRGTTWMEFCFWCSQHWKWHLKIQQQHLFPGSMSQWLWMFHRPRRVQAS